MSLKSTLKKIVKEHTLVEVVARLRDLVDDELNVVEEIEEGISYDYCYPKQVSDHLEACVEAIHTLGMDLNNGKWLETYHAKVKADEDRRKQYDEQNERAMYERLKQKYE